MATKLLPQALRPWFLNFNQAKPQPATGVEGGEAAGTGRKKQRVAVSTYFFMHGLCFASWASRIPTIKASLALSDASMGTVLFALPVGFCVSLPFAAWFVGLLGSRRVVILSATLYALALVGLGVAGTAVALFGALFAFGFCANLLNISINTQAVAVERLYDRPVMAAFHGLWSLGGFAGAAIGTWMMGRDVAPLYHYTFICILFLIANATAAFFIVAHDEKATEKKPLFAMPDKALIGLGIIAFCSMMAEGTMFDWSGLYFIDVVKVKPEYTGLGYTTFMVAMASMRFVADGLSGRFGLRRVLQVSGLLTTCGLLLAVVLPNMVPAMVGFFLIGMGVSSVVPLAYSAAGKSKTLSPGTAITAVSSLGFMGLLIGPPIIGFVAEATSLRMSFLAVTVMSLAVVALASGLKKNVEE